MDKPQTPEADIKKTNQWLLYTGMAFEMFMTIGIFAFLGNFLDKKINTAPFLLIFLLLIGLGIAFYRVLLAVKKMK